MKKGLLFVLLFSALFFTACGGSGLSNKSSRTVEDLMDGYVKAYTTADADIVKEIFPPFYVEYAKDYLTKERLEKTLTSAKETYGDDFNITYNITKTTKMTDDELKELNDAMAYRYNSKDNASECYKYEGTVTFKGSKSEDTDPISSMKYCKYDGSWYIVSY